MQSAGTESRSRPGATTEVGKPEAHKHRNKEGGELGSPEPPKPRASNTSRERRRPCHTPAASWGHRRRAWHPPWRRRPVPRGRRCSCARSPSHPPPAHAHPCHDPRGRTCSWARSPSHPPTLVPRRTLHPLMPTRAMPAAPPLAPRFPFLPVSSL